MENSNHKKPGLSSLLEPYRNLIIGLIALSFAASGLNLAIPKIIARSIDAYTAGNFNFNVVATEFIVAAFFVFIFTYVQSLIQTLTSEKVARDLRTRLANKISRQSYAYVQNTNSAKLLTNLTSDIDSIKLFVAQAIVSIASSLFIIVGASALLLFINWRLALAVLVMIPIIGFTFFFVFAKVKTLFKIRSENIDRLNQVINESILGAALIRVLNSQQPEYEKFMTLNIETRGIGMQILKLFASMIPIITFAANFSFLIIVLYGGHLVIIENLSLGDFTAFSAYVALLIFPIIIIGFMSNVIAQASASYERVNEILEAEEPKVVGKITAPLTGQISVHNLNLEFNNSGKPILKDISFSIKAGTKTAILGPTAAGKTQLLYILTGLIKPDSGEVRYDNQLITEFQETNFHKHLGFVFQDSVVFNTTIRENIAFNTKVTDADLQKSIDTAELNDFIQSLPDGLKTMVSERGTSLSGGQKQRIMLARALALNPQVLFLDDFTARVDYSTEQKILTNIAKNYPNTTIISVTQRIASVKEYDQIIILMEGEMIGIGTHAELLENNPEYMQLYQSQKSTSHYELRT